MGETRCLSGCAERLDADACIQIAEEIIDGRDAIIATLEEELARVRQERDEARRHCRAVWELVEQLR